jgi:hypothetical protein
MDKLLELFQGATGTEIAGIIALAIILFERIAKMTPNTTDNKILVFVRKVASVLGLKVEDKQ